MHVIDPELRTAYRFRDQRVFIELRRSVVYIHRPCDRIDDRTDDVWSET